MNQFPLPLISEMLARVHGARISAEADLTGAYNIIQIKEGDEYTTGI
jgi:hypothetical protein